MSSDSDIAKAAELIGKRNLSLSGLAMGDASDVIEQPEKKRRGRPRKLNDRLDFDETMPLADEREEEMLLSIVAGEAKHLAYKIAYKTAATKRSCTQQASILLRRPDIAKRLSWLMQKKHKIDRQAIEDLEDAARGGLTLDLKIKEVERLLLHKQALSVPDATKLYLLHGQMVDKRDAACAAKLQEMDPTAICEWFRKAEVQGLDVAAMAAASQSDEDTGGSKDLDTEAVERHSEADSGNPETGGALDVVVSTESDGQGPGPVTHAAEFPNKNEENDASVA